ncbi:MAG: lipoprotein [Parcubacteria group bacterium Gr01-1014_31]|nr:MAG: lipoprotein [Parcubacteria group bacterium Gr01-1014_31]
MLAVGTVASSLGIGLFAAFPALQLAQRQMVRMAGIETAPILIKEIPGIGLLNPYTYEDEDGGWDGEAMDVQLTPDGGFIIAGSIEKDPAKNTPQPYLLKIYGSNRPTPDALLNKEWSIVVPADGAARSVMPVFNKKDPATRTLESYVIAGHITNGTSLDGFAAQYGINGNPTPRWTKTYGLATDADTVQSIQQVFNDAGEKNGFVLTGFRIEIATRKKLILLIKIDDSGNLDPSWPQNPKSISIGEFGKDVAYAVRQSFTENGAPNGYILAGQTAKTAANLEALALKLTERGELDTTAWPAEGGNPAGIRLFGGEREESFNDVELKYDALGRAVGYIFGGFSKSFNALRPGDASPYLVVLDRRGATLLQKVESMTVSPTYAVEQTFNALHQPNGYILAGKYNFGIPSFDTYGLRMDTAGAYHWRIMSSGMDVDIANAIKQTPDGGFIMVGKTYSRTYIEVPDPKPSNLYVELYGPEPVPPAPELPDSANLPFRRGDANISSGVDLADAVFTLAGLFLGGPQPACEDAADSNDSGNLDLADPVFTLSYLFLGTGELPPAPGPVTKGPDPTEDPLTCGQYP